MDAKKGLNTVEFFKMNIVEPLEANIYNLRTVQSLLENLITDLPEIREDLVEHVGSLARTFYHTNTVHYLRQSPLSSQHFQKQLDRAYWRGVSERLQLIPQIEKSLKLCQQYSEQEEHLRHYRAVLEEGLQDKDEMIKIQSTFHRLKSPQILERLKNLEEALTISNMLVVNTTVRCRLLHIEYITPLLETLLLEVDGIQKLLDMLTYPQDQRMHTKELSELARTADVLSWGLQDFDLDDHLEHAKEEFSSFSKDFNSLETHFNQIMSQSQVIFSSIENQNADYFTKESHQARSNQITEEK